MLKTRLLTLKIFLFLASLLIILPATAISAQPGRTTCPTDCKDTCEVDISCQNRLIFDKNVDCSPFRCPGKGDEENLNFEGIDLNLFGINIRFNSERAIQQVIVLGFSIFLGIVALAAVMIGVIAAIKRADTTDAGEIAKLNKTMSNAIAGLVIVVVSIAIVQIVASLIGVGNIFSSITFNNLIPDASDFN